MAAASAAVVLAMLAAMALESRDARDQRLRVREFTEVEHPLSLASFELEINAYEFVLKTLMYTETRSQTFLEGMRKDEAQFEVSLTRFEALAVSAEMAGEAGEARRLWAGLKARSAALMRQAEAVPTPEGALASAREREELLATLRRLDDLLDDTIQAHLDRRGVRSFRDWQGQVERHFQVSTLVGLGIIVVVVALGAVIFRGVGEVMDLMHEGTDALAGGNLAYRMKTSRQNEVALLADRFNAMAERLEATTVSKALLSASEARLRQAVERLEQAAVEWRETFDAIPSLVAVLSGTGEVLRINRYGADLCGRAPEACIGHRLPDLSDQEPWRSLEELRGGEWGMPRVVREHEQVWSVSAHPLRDGSKGVLLRGIDITREVTLEERLRQTARAAELGAFVSAIAHEVRNPLFGVLANLEAWEEEAEAAPEYIPRIRREAERLSRLMGDLLEYGKPAPLTLGPVACDAVLARAIRSSERRAGKGVSIEVSSSTKGAHVVLGDASKLEQLVENLVGNALAFAPPGSTVRLVSSIEGGALRCRIEDEGPGFAPEDLARAFEPFYTRRSGGTGLGLAIARRIAQDHGGAVEIANRAGGGAVATFTLPLAGS